MTGHKALLASAVFLLLMSGTASAHHPTGAAGTGQAGPIRTISAVPLEKGKWSFAFQTEYIKFDSFSDEELMAFAGAGQDVHSVDSIVHTMFGVAYGMTEDLTISLKIPYEYLRDIREVHEDEPEEIHRHGNAKGIGDLTVLGQYRFVRTINNGLDAAVLFGLRIPTGRTTDTDDGGERFKTEFQAGTGSWDPIIGLAATKRVDALSLDANILYIIASKGSQDTDLGDVLNLNAAVSYRTFSNRNISWDLIIEANAEWKERQKTGGIRDEHSGGTVLFLSPGLRVSSGRWAAFISVGFPVIQNLEGIQDDTKLRASFGIGISF